MEHNYLIKKWLFDELSPEEWQEFRELDDYELHIKLGEKAKNFGAGNFIETEDFLAFKKRLTARSKPVKTISWYKPLVRIAAVLVIALCAYLAFFANNLTEIETKTGEKITIALPDASEVLLNAVTEIDYNKEEWSEKREISLDGEAYFKVAKGSKFDVNTKMGKVSVLGTVFNVKQRNEFFEVVCYEGKVRVGFKSETIDLLPGDLYRVVKNEVWRDTVTQLRPDWIKNSSSFNGVPFYEVIQEFERQYGVTVEANAVDTNRLFNGGFIHNNLDEALRSITLPLRLQYSVTSKNIVFKDVDKE